ncbi:MAG: DinB family protein [Planctomycetota bacterium]
MIPRPTVGEYSDYFQGYVDLAQGEDVLAELAKQAATTQQMLASAKDGDYCYAEGKWSIKRLMQHITDGERMFCYRAMCVARGDSQNLPDFDQDIYAERDGSKGRTLASITEEYASVRVATCTLFGGFPEDAWQRIGRANGTPIAVRALPWIVLGHDRHHANVLRERYGLSA